MNLLLTSQYFYRGNDSPSPTGESAVGATSIYAKVATVSVWARSVGLVYSVESTVKL